MIKIGLLSDTHSHLEERIFDHFSDCDEIWHAGDFGNTEVSDRLSHFKKLRGVYGNVDGHELRLMHPLINTFELEGLRIFMTHIGGFPGRYAKGLMEKLKDTRPDIFVCGHSHILRVMSDKELNNMLVLNPGAAGRHGFHKIKTLLKFDLDAGKIKNMKAIELGKRSNL